MLDYLTKFNALPQYLKDKMSEPSVLSAIKELEEKYDISLAAVVMKVMVKDVSILDLAKYFVFEYSLDGKKSEQLVEEMKEKVLFVAADHLGFEAKRKDLIGIDKSNIGEKNKIKTSNFFFSSEDEQEVAQLTEKLGPKDKTKKVNEERLNTIANEVVFETGVSFSSADLSERFIKVLKTYARGVRNRIDSKLTLTKEIDKGGLGMSDGRAEEVLKSLDRKNKESEKKLPELKLNKDSLEKEGGNEEEKIEKPENDNKNSIRKEGGSLSISDNKSSKDLSTPENKPKNESNKNTSNIKPNVEKFREKMGKVAEDDSRDVAYDISDLSKKAPEKPKVLSKPKLDSKGLPIKDTSSMVGAGSLEIPKEKKQEKKLDDHIAGKGGKFKKRVVVPDTGKKKIEDVKMVPKLTGPIEELRGMNMVDFRRLDPDALRAAAKIKEKINLLEEDGLLKKVEGINAWRDSLMFREYIDIGRKSIGQRKPINEIIHDKNISGHDALREEEFEAILNLNREIRI